MRVAEHRKDIEKTRVVVEGLVASLHDAVSKLQSEATELQEQGDTLRAVTIDVRGNITILLAFVGAAILFNVFRKFFVTNK